MLTAEHIRYYEYAADGSTDKTTDAKGNFLEGKGKELGSVSLKNATGVERLSPQKDEPKSGYVAFFATLLEVVLAVNSVSGALDIDLVALCCRSMFSQIWF